MFECCRTIDLIPHICAIRKDTCGWLDRIGKGREGRRGICRTEGCPRVGRGIRCGCTPWRVLMGFDLKPSNNITQHSPIQPAHHQSSQSIAFPPPHHDEPVAVQACRCHLSPLSVIRPIKHPLYPSSSSSFIFFSNLTLSITGFTFNIQFSLLLSPLREIFLAQLFWVKAVVHFYKPLRLQYRDFLWLGGHNYWWSSFACFSLQGGQFFTLLTRTLLCLDLL